jgi:hypothetical protein
MEMLLRMGSPPGRASSGNDRRDHAAPKGDD